ncbi:MAG TPA: class I SAM-dependent methyltransferase [Candidatus Binataceae bacterium]|nr:class I SAM-dependent methyltransferase [Candidatus Binataceae bacterium]
MSVWYEDDDFWETWEPYMFPPARLQNTPGEVDALVGHLELPPAACVLDFCCGIGRHSIEFARRGFAVTAVDRTRRYLERARNQADADGLKIEFIESDARAFHASNRFDAAINMFTSFGYFEDPAQDFKVEQILHASLKPAGRLIIDVNGKEILARKFQERVWSQHDDGSLGLEERKIHSGWDWIDSRWILVRGGQVREWTVSTRLYSGAEMSDLLRRAGFGKVLLLGNLAGVPYDHNAERLIAVATK